MMPERLDVYLRDAAALRRALKLNEDDREFVAQGGQIRYVLDANVVRLFTWPSGQRDMLSMFSRWLDDQTRETTASLTTEYLMSRRLPGQRDEPVLISPEHFEEVLGSVDELVRRLESRPRTEQEQLDDLARKQNEIRIVGKELAQAGMPPIRKMEELARRLPQWLKSIVEDELSAAARLSRCLDGAGALRRINGEGWFHSTMEETDPRVLLDWFERLHRARLERHAQLGRTPDEALRIERSRQLNAASDARTMATLLRASRMLDPGDPIRIVFVTADSAIRRASEQLFAEEMLADPKAKIALAVRHPREFTPLLNLPDLSTASGSAQHELQEVLERIRSLLDELFVDIPGEPTEGQMGASLAHHGARRDWKTRKPLERAEIADTLTDLRSNWNNAVKVANGLSVDLLDQHYKGLFDDVVRMVEDEDIINASVERIRNSLRQLRQEHANLTIDGIFLRLREADRTLDAPRDLRVPLIWRNASLFADIIGDRSINTYLRDLAAGKVPDDPTDVLASRATEGRVQLFMSCVCLAARLWQPARTFAERALEQLDDDRVNRPEALYIAAMAARFATLDRRTYRGARDRLAECIQTHAQARELHREVRGRIEAAALVVSALYHDAWHRLQDATHVDAIIEERDRATELDRAWSELSRAVDILENDIEDSGSEMALTLSLQARVKQCALVSYWVTCTSGLPPSIIALVPKLRLALAEEARAYAADLGQPRQLAQVYGAVMDALELGTSAAQQAALDKLGSAAATHLISTVDRYQFDVLRLELDEKFAAVSPLDRAT